MTFISNRLFARLGSTVITDAAMSERAGSSPQAGGLAADDRGLAAGAQAAVERPDEPEEELPPRGAVARCALRLAPRQDLVGDVGPVGEHAGAGAVGIEEREVGVRARVTGSSCSTNGSPVVMTRAIRSG